MMPCHPRHRAVRLAQWCQIGVKASNINTGARLTSANPAYLSRFERVTDGARTRDLRSHNPMLYQLSYGHQARGILPAKGRVANVMRGAFGCVQSPQPRNSVFLS